MVSAESAATTSSRSSPVSLIDSAYGPWGRPESTLQFEDPAAIAPHSVAPGLHTIVAPASTTVARTLSVATASGAPVEVRRVHPTWRAPAHAEVKR